MSKLKVYGGCIFICGHQCRAFVAAKSLKRASELMNHNYRYMRDYWSQTWNDVETGAALSKPETCFYHVGNHFSKEVKEFTPHTPTGT